MKNFINFDESSCDILKLNLLEQTLDKLDSSIAQLVENNQISINELRIDPLTNELKVSLNSHRNVDNKALTQFTDAFTTAVNDSLSQYIYK